jgi:hypothetical protein
VFRHISETNVVILKLQDEARRLVILGMAQHEDQDQTG